MPDIPIDIGARVKDLCSARSIKHETLCEHTGVSTATMSRLLNGHSDMTVKQLTAIARALELPVEYVISARRPLFVSLTDTPIVNDLIIGMANLRSVRIDRDAWSYAEQLHAPNYKCISSHYSYAEIKDERDAHTVYQKDPVTGYLYMGLKDELIYCDEDHAQNGTRYLPMSAWWATENSLMVQMMNNTGGITIDHLTLTATRDSISRGGSVPRVVSKNWRGMIDASTPYIGEQGPNEAPQWKLFATTNGIEV